MALAAGPEEEVRAGRGRIMQALYTQAEAQPGGGPRTLGWKDGERREFQPGGAGGSGTSQERKE